MIGKEIAQLQAVGRAAENVAADRKRETFVEIRNFGRRNSIASMDLTVGKGEIVGLAGLLGSGRTETARLLFGVDKPQTGEMLVKGRKVMFHSPRQAIREGFAFTPEDRKSEGIVPHLSVRENIILALQARQGATDTLARGRQEEIADKFIKLLGIRTPGSDQAVMSLSGGNQQKVLLARWLATQPRFLILDEPTRGIDVGSKIEIEKLMHILREEGMAILFISSELEEVVRDSQRVIVLRDRAKAGELSGDEINQETIMSIIAGHERGA
jgi:simple sugar transport system ATP-binding protein